MVGSVSLLPPHIYAKKIPYGTEVIVFCVCTSPLQSQITFDILVGWQPNFQGLPNSSQVIFGRVTQTPGPSG